MAEKIVVFYDLANGDLEDKNVIREVMKSLRSQGLASKKKIKLCFNKPDAMKHIIAAKSYPVYALEVCSNGKGGDLSEIGFPKGGKVIQTKLEFDGTEDDFLKKFVGFREGLRS